MGTGSTAAAKAEEYWKSQLVPLEDIRRLDGLFPVRRSPGEAAPPDEVRYEGAFIMHELAFNRHRMSGCFFLSEMFLGGRFCCCMYVCMCCWLNPLNNGGVAWFLLVVWSFLFANLRLQRPTVFPAPFGFPAGKKPCKPRLLSAQLFGGFAPVIKK